MMSMNRLSCSCILGLSLGMSEAAPGAEYTVGAKATTNLPTVLLIGDSISMAYTPVVQAALRGVADVSHPPENCTHTAYGLKQIKTWLGTNKWAVIHFNFGIHDTGTEGITPEVYRENLTQLVGILEGTGARLIWANSTPLTASWGKRSAGVIELNQIATNIMVAHKIPIVELYELVMPNVKDWQTGDGCHLTKQGTEEAGKQVAEAIRQALSKSKPK